jgi:uncharacterized protein YbaP (TraB family)
MWTRTCSLLVVCLALGSCDLWRPAQGVAWEFERNGTRVLLIPTVHVGSEQPARLSSAFRERLLANSTLLVEVNSLDPSVLQEIKDCQYRSAPISSPQISEQVAERMIELFPDVRDEVRRNPPKTSAASAFILGRASAQVKLNEKHGLDLQLIETFKQANKPVRSLEGACAQLSQIGLANALITDDAVLESLNMYSSGDYSRLPEQVHAGWRRGAWRSIKCALLDADRKYPYHRTVDTVLIESRNPGLAAAISQFAVGDVEIAAAVGAKHFVGNKSLPLELIALGFRTRVDVSEWVDPCHEPRK